MDLQDPMQAFKEAAEAKERRGVLEHRGGDASLPFNGNLFDEYEDEQLDSFNFLVRLHTDGTIADDEFRHGAEQHMNSWFWMNRNVRLR